MSLRTRDAAPGTPHQGRRTRRGRHPRRWQDPRADRRYRSAWLRWRSAWLRYGSAMVDVQIRYGW